MLDNALPSSVRQRIGDEACLDFSLWIDARGESWKADVLESCTLRFGAMLAEELGKVRVELHQEIAGVKREIGELRSDVKQAITSQGAGLRQEMTTQRAELREEIASQGAALRQEMATTRVDVLRWAFLFWLGQIATMAALLSLMR